MKQKSVSHCIHYIWYNRDQTLKPLMMASDKEQTEEK